MTKRLRLACVGLLLCSLYPHSALAQYGEQIRSDRPGQGLSAYTVGKRALAVQSGATFTQINYAVSSISRKQELVPELQLRYGLTRSFELSLGLSSAVESLGPTDSRQRDARFNGFSVAMRSNVREADGWLPAIGYQVAVNIPQGNQYPELWQAGGKLTLLTTQSPFDRWSFNTVSGVEWANGVLGAQAFYIANVGFNISSSVSVFAEHYGFASSAGWNGFADAGVAWLLTDNLQLDVFGGYNPATLSDSWFVSSGISWRTSRK